MRGERDTFTLSDAASFKAVSKKRRNRKTAERRKRKAEENAQKVEHKKPEVLTVNDVIKAVSEKRKQR